MKLIQPLLMAVCAAALAANGCASGTGGSGAGGTTSSGGSQTTAGQSGSAGSGSGGHTGSGGGSVGSGGGNPAGSGGAASKGGASGSSGGVTGTGGSTSGTGGSATGGAAGNSGVSGNGGAGNGGATGTGGAAGATGACRPKFGSGVNVAWFNYAADVPNPDMTKFDQLYTDTFAVGGRIVRWWFHTNGSKTPTYDATTGLATTISAANIADIKKILDGAAAAGQAVVVSLWAFDMLQSSQISATILQNNKNLLQKDANRQAYVDNVITPLVTALKGHPGLYAWEVFNEPEGNDR